VTAVAFLKRDKLIAKVDEGHLFAFAAKLKFEYPSVKRECFFDVAYFKRDVIEPDSARSLGFRHKTLQQRLQV